MLISESYVDLKSSRDRSQALRPRTNMYSRQGKHPQRVNGTPPGTPDPPSRPSAPGRPPRAPMSDHTSRDRARQHSRRVRHAAHHRTRLRAYESRAPGTNAWVHTQRARQAQDDSCLAHTCTILTTRKQRARDALHERCGSLGSRWPVSNVPMHSLVGLRREGRE